MALAAMAKSVPLSEDNWGSPVSYLLVKLAARCNLNCTYCYWFKDPDVYRRAAVMGDRTAAALVKRIREQIELHRLDQFKILFHGGEPLLFKASRFDQLLADLVGVGRETGCSFDFSITTNGVLLDQKWVDVLRRYRVNTTISIDGPSNVHDRRRIDLRGRPTHGQVVEAINLLDREQLPFGLLAVCDPQSSSAEVVDYFVDQLGVRKFNILIPDAKHGDNPVSIAKYFKALFEYVYSVRGDDRIRVTLLSNMIRGLLGGGLRTESIGIGPINTVTVLTDGELQALDVTRIAGDGFTRSSLNIHRNAIEEIKTDPLWQELYLAGTNHHPKCQACTWYNVCGAGHVSTRWSNENRYRNVSVYCDDFQEIYSHLWDRVCSRLTAVEAAAS